MAENWRRLVEDCISGKRGAQLMFYKQYAPLLYNACKRMLVVPEASEEALQDAFIKILANMHDFEIEAQLIAWMRSIVQRTAIDHLRRKPLETCELDERTADRYHEEDEAVDEAIIKHRAEQIKQAAELLPPGYRIVLSLYLFEGYDMEEIAEVLSLKPASVRSQYLRGKVRLLDILNKNNFKHYP